MAATTKATRAAIKTRDVTYRLSSRQNQKQDQVQEILDLLNNYSIEIRAARDGTFNPKSRLKSEPTRRSAGVGAGFSCRCNFSCNIENYHPHSGPESRPKSQVEAKMVQERRKEATRITYNSLRYRENETKRGLNERQTRAKVIRLRPNRVTSQMIMWPTRRQLVVLCFISVVLTSLLATTLDVKQTGRNYKTQDTQQVQKVNEFETKLRGFDQTPPSGKTMNCSLFNANECHQDKLISLIKGQEKPKRPKGSDWRPLDATSSQSWASLRSPTVAPSTSTESAVFSIEAPKEASITRDASPHVEKPNAEAYPKPIGLGKNSTIGESIRSLKGENADSLDDSSSSNSFDYATSALSLTSNNDQTKDSQMTEERQKSSTITPKDLGGSRVVLEPINQQQVKLSDAANQSKQVEPSNPSSYLNTFKVPTSSEINAMSQTHNKPPPAHLSILTVPSFAPTQALTTTAESKESDNTRRQFQLEQPSNNPAAFNELWRNVLGNTIGQLLTLSAMSSAEKSRQSSEDELSEYQRSLFRDNKSPMSLKGNEETEAQQPIGYAPRRQHHFEADSGSAPSVALPPLTHLFSPRNPFRLFASAAAPPMTRIRPALLLSTANRQRHRNKQNSQQYKQPDMFNLAESLVTSADRPSGSVLKSPTNMLDQAPMPPPQISQNLNLAESSGRLLYAHSQSVEQLEKLIRAATNTGGGSSPIILPAIVSGPNGPIPGFYIPALDQSDSSTNSMLSPGSSASQSHSSLDISPSSSSVFNHLDFGMPSASHQSGISHVASSKIPGTDYILHPEEVRAMINIGELAWRKQLASDSSKRQPQQQASHARPSQDKQVQSASTRPQPSISFYRAQQNQGNLMQENHAENARDFAYIESPDSNRQQIESSSSTAIKSTPNTKPIGIFRLNKHHFVRVQPKSKGEKQESTRTISVKPESKVHEQRLLELASIAPTHMVLSNEHQHRGPIQMAPLRQAQPARVFQPKSTDNTMVRMATQLTPREISLVEDSVLEALLTAQHSNPQAQRIVAPSPFLQTWPAFLALQAPAPLQIRQNMFPSASRSHFSWISPNQQTEDNQNAQTKRPTGWLGSFRLRRRHSNPKPNTGNSNAIGQQPFIMIGTDSTPAAASTIMSIVPLINVSTLLPDSHLTPNPLIFHRLETSSPIDSSRSRYSTNYPSGILADQDTNKQPKLGQNIMAAESNPSTVYDETASQGYGSRIMTSPSMIQYPKLESKQSEGHQSKQASVSMDGKLFRPHERLSLLIGVSNDGRRKPNDRINVDWPAMASDADYFPTKATSPEGREISLQDAPERSKSQNSNGHSVFTLHNTKEGFSVGGNIPDMLSVQPSMIRGYNQYDQVHRRRPQSHHKLQFAPDYQAREGVPIYNNNVRISGSLVGRQRSTDFGAESREVDTAL